MTAEETKPFSKEWWLELATNTDHEFSRYFKKLELYDYVSLNRAQREYCAKRYAEAYHREKMKETLNSILEDMDCTSVEYHHEIVEEYLEELTKKIKE